MLRKAMLSLVGAVGLTLILLTVVFGFWSKSAAVHGLVESFKPGYEPAAMHASQESFQTVSAMARQLQGEAIPGLAHELHTTPAKLTADLAQQYPAVGTGLADMPGALVWFQDMAQRISHEHADYEKAAAIPVKGVSATVVPWLMVIPGAVLLLGALIALLWRPGLSRRVSIVALVIGGVLVIFPIASSLPSKARAVDGLIHEFRPILTGSGPAKTARYVTVMAAMGTQFSGQALPGLARELHVTPAQLQNTLKADYPAVAKGLRQLPSIITQFRAQSRIISANVGNYSKAARLPWKGAPAIMLFWFLVIPGILAALAGAVVVAGQRVMVPLPRLARAAETASR